MEKYTVRYEDRGKRTKSFITLYSAAVFWDANRGIDVLDQNGNPIDEDVLWEAICSYDYLYKSF